MILCNWKCVDVDTTRSVTWHLVFRSQYIVFLMAFCILSLNSDFGIHVFYTNKGMETNIPYHGTPAVARHSIHERHGGVNSDEGGDLAPLSSDIGLVRLEE
jgi:hypothetical protein